MTSPLLAPPPNPGVVSDANVEHGRRKGALIAAATDADLVAAYVESMAASTVGVDYFVSQECERRGLRDPRTRDLTPTARRLVVA